MNTQETRTEITLEQFLEEVKGKPCCVESPDTDVISVDIRGCRVSSACGGLDFENMLDTFEIEKSEINGIYVEGDNEFYIEFGDVFAVTVIIMSEEIYNKLLGNLKQALSKVSDSIIKTI